MNYDLYQLFDNNGNFNVPGNIIVGGMVKAHTLGDYLGRSVSTEDIITHITCFRADTTLVTMLDGSQKLIKDVKTGEKVLGWDVNKKQFCETVVLRNFRTGSSDEYTCYIFEDGTTLDIYGNDKFVYNLRKDGFAQADADGDFISCMNISSALSYAEKGSFSRKIVKQDVDDNGVNHCVALVHAQEFTLKEPTDRYSLYTSNGTFFVNGLLATTNDAFYRWALAWNLEVPDNIKAIYNEIRDLTCREDESLPNTKVEDPEYVSDVKKLLEVKLKINKHKEYLADTDYKALKFAEGALSEEDWLPVKAKREETRAAIKREEEKLNELTERVQEHNPATMKKFYPDRWEARNVLWKQVMAILNDHYEDFCEWINGAKTVVIESFDSETPE